MAYLGQGAQLITNGDVVIANVFYSTIPGGAGSGMYWYARRMESMGWKLNFMAGLSTC